MKFCLAGQVDPIEVVGTDFCWEVCTDDGGNPARAYSKIYEPCKLIEGSIENDEHVVIQMLCA